MNDQKSISRINFHTKTCVFTAPEAQRDTHTHTHIHMATRQIQADRLAGRKEDSMSRQTDGQANRKRLYTKPNHVVFSHSWLKFCFFFSFLNDLCRQQ